MRQPGSHFEYAGRRAHPPRLAPRRRDRASPRELVRRSRPLLLQPDLRPRYARLQRRVRSRPRAFCASTETRGEGGFDSSVAVGDTAGQTFPVQASRSGSAGGDFASSAAASCSAEPGVVRAIASAGAFGNGEASSSGDADASFLDRGPLTPIGGAAPGAAVTFHVTVDVAGAFIGEGGGGDAALKIYRNGAIAHERTITTNVLQPQLSDAFDLPGFVAGDDVALYLRLRAFAGAVDDPDSLSAATADLGDSAHVYVDITSGNARFDAASGHDYRLAPEPAGSGLLAVGGAVLAAAHGWRRRRLARRLPLD